MSEQNDTEESDFDPNFKLDPLPKAADIIAELPDYPDSDEEREVRNIMRLIKTTEPAAAVPEKMIAAGPPLPPAEHVSS